MNTVEDNPKSKPYRVPTPLTIKSDTPLTITDGKFTMTHCGSIVFHGDYVEFELEETENVPKNDAPHDESMEITLHARPSSLPEGYEWFLTTDAKTLAWGRKRSKYVTYKRAKDVSYITYINRNGDNNPPIHLGSLLDPESLISVALKEFSKTESFLRRDIKAENMPISLGQGQRVKTCLDVLEKEGFLVKTPIKVGKKRTMDKYVRTDKKLD
jgi:hypothetical protein